MRSSSPSRAPPFCSLLAACSWGCNAAGREKCSAPDVTVDLLVSATIDNGALTKTDTGTMKLTGANTFTGATLISGGTLESGAANALGATASLTVNTGGTLLLSGTGDRINNGAGLTLDGGIFRLGDNAGNETLGTLTLSANSIIDFGTVGGKILTFSGASATWTGTLSIWNWSGTFGNGGGSDQLRFTSGSLTSTQLGQIAFFSGAGSGPIVGGLGNAFVGSFGEVVPVPEPSSVFIGLAMCGLAGLRERRRERQARRATR